MHVGAPLPDDQSPMKKRTPEVVCRQRVPLLVHTPAVGQNPGVGHDFNGRGDGSSDTLCSGRFFDVHPVDGVHRALRQPNASKAGRFDSL